uniref:Uncharacterized protein n=1 Tax=Anguilla anguilla TaxID=7936 RepID=A0A0E9PJB0_ANGAN
MQMQVTGRLIKCNVKILLPKAMV